MPILFLINIIPRWTISCPLEVIQGWGGSGGWLDGGWVREYAYNFAVTSFYFFESQGGEIFVHASSSLSRIKAWIMENGNGPFPSPPQSGHQTQLRNGLGMRRYQDAVEHSNSIPFPILLNLTDGLEYFYRICRFLRLNYAIHGCYWSRRQWLTSRAPIEGFPQLVHLPREAYLIFQSFLSSPVESSLSLNTFKYLKHPSDHLHLLRIQLSFLNTHTNMFNSINIFQDQSHHSL